MPFVLCALLPAQSDRSREVRAEITYVASALASGNPTDALGKFDKSAPDYDRLSDYFAALTNSYDLTSQVEILDENDAETESTLKVNWALELTDRASNTSTRRSTDVTVRLKQNKGKWKIVALTPVEFFNPQQPRR